jgi:hypothetical protein
MHYRGIQVQLNDIPALLFAAVLLSVVIAVRVYKNRQYKKGAYYQITKNSHSSVRRDKGKYGEYLTYKYLRHFENSGGKFLFNILIPKEIYGTTEIDALLICSKGLFVFESKNYSGWILGNEAHENWTQIIPKGRSGSYHKEYFYSPVMQNAQHIKHLKRLLDKNVLTHSVIVFSDRCTLTDIAINSDNVRVIKRNRVAHVVKKICNQTQTNILTATEIMDIYNKLYPYTQLSSETKKQHIEDVRNMRGF